jgi:hypothetical protein
VIFPDAAMVSAKRTKKPHRTRLLPPSPTPAPNGRELRADGPGPLGHWRAR